MNLSKIVKNLSVIALLCSTVLSCKTSGRFGVSDTALKSDQEGVGAGYCAALRGNGDRINALVNSLARVVEHYGVPSAVSGGSSASIVAFLLESMTLNPAVKSAVTPADRALRVSFLLKSIWDYAALVGQTEEGILVNGLSDLAAAPDPISAVKLAMKNSTLGGVVNAKEIERMLGDPQHQQDLQKQIQSFGNFDASNPKILFIPGLINFKFLARALSRMGDFYAGRGAYFPEDEFSNLVRQCAESGRGKTWEQFKGESLGALDGTATNCGPEFRRILAAYRKKRINAEPSLGFQTRVDEPIGAYLPAIISTSVTSDPEFVNAYTTSLAHYWANEPLDFTPDFSKVKVGYWGRKEDLVNIEGDPLGFKDEKTRRFESLLYGRPAAPWFEALATSPAEPGLSAAQYLSDEKKQISFGGWSDLQPVLVLKNIGCKEVVYLTRKGETESVFAMGVAAQLGMGAKEKALLFDYNNQDGSISAARQSIQNADAVHCTNWNDVPRTPAGPLALDSYTAPMVFKSQFFKTDRPGGFEVYKNEIAVGQSYPGCIFQ